MPTKNEYDNIRKLMFYVSPKFYFSFMDIQFIIVDDSDIKEYKKLKGFLLSQKNCICVMGANGYKNSVLLGIRL